MIVVNFSARTWGNCAAIARLVARETRARCVDFSELHAVPCGMCDCQCFQPDGQCPHRSDGLFGLYEAIAKADSAVFVLPNYMNYPCSNYFVFNERSQCYFGVSEARLNDYLRTPKKFIVVSNTEEDTFRAVLSQQVCEEERAEILFLHAKAYGKVSLKGDLMDAPEAKAAVLAFVGR